MLAKSKLLPVLLVLISPGVSQAALSFDFNTPGQFTNNFSTSQTSGLIAEGASGGLSNSGHVDLGLIGASQVWTLDTPFRGDLSSWSAEFYLKGTFFTQFGFTTTSSPQQVDGMPTNDGQTAYLSGIAMGSGNMDGGMIGLYDDSELIASALTSEELTDTWYRYRISVDYIGSNNFNVTGIIHTSTSSGTLLNQVGFVQSTINNPALASADQAHLFLGFNQFGDSVDNFSTTIPEPSGLGLSMLSAFVLFRRRR
ncbi:hypothetical protein JIN84_06100 [Luteolibacter yonseiensis]|uniref:PEP-CTERM protein-sorting domain-containing protein n=1 Tax=Luteolibacter yonseiensis TaxID=1144680 RepID=A0A934R477_9BACT|nr:hypothetical protein [Luteolibacter yonseiensis]MBK1815175.1 hypothetical protein [Luteolibacter yonseiensis]